MELVKLENNQIVVSDSLVNTLKEFEKKRVEIEIQEKQLKEELLESMEKYGITNWQTEDGAIKAVYRSASTRTTIDSARLKKELPDVADEYSKTTNVKSSVSLTIEV